MTSQYILRKAEQILSRVEGREVKLLPFFNLPEPKAVLTVEEILEVVKEVTGVPKKEITGKSRKVEIVSARHLLSYFCLQYKIKNTVTMGDYLDMDHSTIINQRRNVEAAFITKDEYIYPTYLEIRERLKALEANRDHKVKDAV